MRYLNSCDMGEGAEEAKEISYFGVGAGAYFYNVSAGRKYE